MRQWLLSTEALDMTYRVEYANAYLKHGVAPYFNCWEYTLYSPGGSFMCGGLESVQECIDWLKCQYGRHVIEILEV